MPLLRICPLYLGDQFYWWRDPECMNKLTDLACRISLIYFIT